MSQLNLALSSAALASLLLGAAGFCVKGRIDAKNNAIVASYRATIAQ